MSEGMPASSGTDRRGDGGMTDGVLTGVTGLDYLLRDRGFPFTEDYGNSILVRGNPGTGKTVLCVQMCCRGFLKSGFHILYYDLEQTEGKLLHLIDEFELVDPPGKTAPPKFFEYKSQTGSNTRNFQDFLEKEIGDPEDGSKYEALGVRYLVVLDSIDALVGKCFERGDLDVVRQKLLRHGHWILLVAEATGDNRDEYSFLDYMVDIVINLRERSVSEHSRRFIEISKCRGGEHIRGEHVFAIWPNGRDDKEGLPGIRVFPSLDAKLSIWRLTAPPLKQHCALDLGLDALTDMLGCRQEQTGPASTLYTGDPGSNKAACALHFALANRRKCKGRTAIVSLGRTESSLARLARAYGALRILLLEGEDRFNPEKIEFVYIAPGRHPAPKLICGLENLIPSLGDSALDGREPVSRAVVLDISQLESRFPSLADEPTFLCALVEFFRWRGICSLFVETETRMHDEERGHDAFCTPMSGLVDNVLVFRRFFFGGTEHIAVQARRKHGTPPEGGCRELRVGGEPDGAAKICVESTLEGLTGIDERAPRYSPVRAYLFEENRLEELLNDRTVALLRCALSGAELGEELKVQHFSPWTSSALYGAMTLDPIFPPQETVIAQLDDFWVRPLAAKGALASAPPQGVARVDTTQYVQAAFVEDVDTVPIYLNFGVLARRECVAPPGPHSGWADWRSLYTAVEDVWREKGDLLKQKNVVPFDFGMHAQESWSCLLLEVLLGAGGWDGQCSEEMTIGLAESSVVDALAWLHKLYWLGRDFSSRKRLLWERYYLAIPLSPTDRGSVTMIERRPLPQSNLDGKALVARCWYTNFCQFVADVDEAESSWVGEYRLDAVPGGPTVRGDWHWAVMSRSSSHLVGWLIVRKLAEPALALERNAVALGLPPQECFYREGVELVGPDGVRTLRDLKETIWEQAASRSSIPCYHVLSPILARCLAEVLSVKPGSEGAVRESIARACESYQRLLFAALEAAETPEAVEPEAQAEEELGEEEGESEADEEKDE